MPSVGDPSGEGSVDVPSAPSICPLAGVFSVPPEPDPGEGVVDNVETACSEIAVVGTAFAAATLPAVAAPNGMPLEKREEEPEPRDAREVERRGED